jgi:ABC-type transporter Mla subunit MlaD
MNDQDKKIADLEELTRELISMISENSGKLDTMSSLFAKTKVATENAVTHTRTLAENSDWEKRSKAITAIITKVLEKDHTALHAASKAAQEMRSLSVEITHRANVAAEAMNDKSGLFDRATRHLLGITEAHQRGQWRRWVLTACLCLLCGAVGFFARDAASDLIWSCFLGRGYGGSIWYSIAPLALVGSFCGVVGFFISKRV